MRLYAVIHADPAGGNWAEVPALPGLCVRGGRAESYPSICVGPSRCNSSSATALSPRTAWNSTRGKPLVT